MHAARTETERRKARRFALELPVVFRWVNNGQTACEATGVCRDISPRGVFVIACSATPALSCRLDLVVLLPPFNPRAPALRLHSCGSVVRVEVMGEGVGVGIASAFGDFENSDWAASSTSQEKAAIPCA
jgi:hypothetical protein